MWGFWQYPCLRPIYTSRPPSCPLLFTHGSCQANISPTRDCASSTKVRTGLLDPLCIQAPEVPLTYFVSVGHYWPSVMGRETPFFQEMCLKEWTKTLDSRETGNAKTNKQKNPQNCWEGAGGKTEIPISEELTFYYNFL